MKRTSNCQVFSVQDQKFGREFQEKIAGIGDLAICLHGKSLKAHRAVLMQRSDYFKTMFSGGFSETDAASVDLSEMFSDVSEASNVIDFMYTGNISLSEENISCVLNIACLFLMTDLQNICSEFLIANISPGTCMSILCLAERFNLKKVQNGCLEIIRSWFPSHLCDSDNAVEMPFSCLKILLSENVFALMPDEVKQTFLQKWNAFFTDNGEIILLSEEIEVAELIKTHLSQLDKKRVLYPEVCEYEEDDYDEETSEEEEDVEGKGKFQDVLLTVVAPSGSDQEWTEVHPFVQETKTWKLVLRHVFSDLGASEVNKFIGITEKKAYFMFRSDFVRHTEEVVSVDLQTKEESHFKLPKKAWRAGVTPYFLWDDKLCAFCSVDHDTWSLYRNDHESLCAEQCTGDCWVRVCKMPTFKSMEFLTKVYQGKLYVWLQECEVREEMSVFCITEVTDGRKKYKVVKLPSPVGSDADSASDCEEEESGEETTRNDEESEDEAVDNEEEEDEEYFHFDVITLSSITEGPKEGSLTFTVKYDALETILDFASNLDTFHNERNYIYDVTKKRWKKSQVLKVVYPEFERVVQTSHVVHRNDSVEADEYAFLEEACLYGYFARSTSPYTTRIWKTDPEKKDLKLLTYIPCTLGALRFLKPGVMPTKFLKNLPDASFDDYSAEIGQSATLRAVLPNTVTDFKMKFSRRLLDGETYESRWLDKWESAVMDSVN